MVDVFMALMLPNAGDELQGIKRGIMEMGDIFVITKADGKQIQQAQLARQQISSALRLLRPKSPHWQPKVLTISAVESRGIKEVWECCEEYFAESKRLGAIDVLRAEQNKQWLHSVLENRLRQVFYEYTPVTVQLPILEQAVLSGEMLPPVAAEKLLAYLSIDSKSTKNDRTS